MWIRIIQRLLSIQFVVFILKHSKRISFPGFEKIPIYDVARFFWQAITKGSLSMRASAVSFSFFLALFPTIIFLFTLIPYIPIENFQEQLMGLLKSFMPYDAYQATEETILDIVTNQRGGLLSIGFLSAMYFSTNGFDALITAFNNTYHDFETRSGFQQRMVSILLVIIATLLLMAAIVLVIFCEYALNRIFHEDKVSYYLIHGGQWIALFGLFYSLISFTFYLGPSRKSGWKFASAGSVLATILSIVMSVGFAYYVNNFGAYNKLYGSIGTLIVVLLWIYFNSLVVLAGFDLNASIREAKKNKEASLKHSSG
ncbi:MAG: YihY/virulence factor BrkB family protein [Bacteroidetes bacterium]|nr:MAG: YihY/virulence factor BrkB family protein [Bacteroidota bacterium]